jgi:hypothetical protein
LEKGTFQLPLIATDRASLDLPYEGVDADFGRDRPYTNIRKSRRNCPDVLTLPTEESALRVLGQHVPR